MGRQLRLELRRPASWRREAFIVTATNAVGVRAVDAWPNWHGGCLALIGPEGSGKTHLAHIWAERAGASVLQSGEAASTLGLARLQGRPVLFEDADRGAPDEGLFHLINMAGADGGALLLTARSAPSAWPTALPDLRSRLNALPVAELPAPDDAILEGVLTKLFLERNIKPADDLIPYLLRRIERSIPRAEEIVARLDETADAEQRAVSRSLARQILEIDDSSRDLFD
jgi:chromosomal replication initiation ATPase DnaA